MKRTPQTTKRFRKDYAKLKKSGRYNMQKLHKIMENVTLEEKEMRGSDTPLEGYGGAHCASLRAWLRVCFMI